MTIAIRLVRFALTVVLLVFGRSALAAPYGCVSGYSDNTCITRIVSGTIPAPQCPTAAGWTTTASAQWIGSGYAAPQCNYQAPPSCSNGYTQVSAAVWNGSSWSAPSCVLTAQPHQPQDLINTCKGVINAMLVPGDTFSTWEGGSWDAGPYDGNANINPMVLEPAAMSVLAVSGNFVLQPLPYGLSLIYRSTPWVQVVEAESVDAPSDSVVAYFCVIDPNTGNVVGKQANPNSIFVNEGGG